MPSHRIIEPAPKASAIAERLLAHARLCVEIARECSSDETAEKLRQMAKECASTAAEIAPLGETKPSIRH
jgi:hypothetical protein